MLASEKDRASVIGIDELAGEDTSEPDNNALRDLYCRDDLISSQPLYSDIVS